ncbi:MAG: methyl-accepting chemotaxis protein [Deltaproteobacteria bacterium]|nr:methyl-accepting chemotaxis protein [Deltaproteobacteria bacterium]
MAVFSPHQDELAAFEHAFEAAVAGIKAELTQVQSVARSAVSPLLNSFKGIDEVLASQRRLLNSVASSLTASLAGDPGAPLMRSTGKLLDQFVDLVVCVGGNSMQIIERLMVLAGHVETMSKTTVGIDHLARESRFVAFNARIQTIRAGDKGRTFEVIADEVKRLASRSAQMSAHIRAEVLATAQNVDFIRESAAMLASHDMNTAIESRTRLLNVIERLDQVNLELQTTIGEVSALVLTATRALQFEDRLSQIVHQATGTLESFAGLAMRGLHALEGKGGADAATLRQVNADFASLAAADRSSPEAQGDIELF